MKFVVKAVRYHFSILALEKGSQIVVPVPVNTESTHSSLEIAGV